MKSTIQITYFDAVAVRRARENFRHNFFALVVYSGRLHHDCCGPKHQKQKRVHVEQRSEVAMLDGTGKNNKLLLLCVSLFRQ